MFVTASLVNSLVRKWRESFDERLRQLRVLQDRMTAATSYAEWREFAQQVRTHTGIYLIKLAGRGPGSFCSISLGPCYWQISDSHDSAADIVAGGNPHAAPIVKVMWSGG